MLAIKKLPANFQDINEWYFEEFDFCQGCLPSKGCDFRGVAMMRQPLDAVIRSESNRGWLDRLGIGLALLCAVHCMLTPVALLAVPLLAGAYMMHPAIHAWMFVMVVPVTVLAIGFGCRKHRDRVVGIWAVSGLVLLAAGIVVGHSPITLDWFAAGHSGHGHSAAIKIAESMLTLFGGVLLIGSHLRNRRLCREQACFGSEGWPHSGRHT